jgi:phosphatidylglycerophosphate synthase
MPYADDLEILMAPFVIDTAVVVCPRVDSPEAGLLAFQVAGLPLLTRTLLTAQRAGIRRFAIVASGSQQAALRAVLEGEARLRGQVRWIEPADDHGIEAPCILLLPPPVILDAEALREWLAQVVDKERVAATDDADLGPLAVPVAHLTPCIQAMLQGQPDLKMFLEKLDEDGRLVRLSWKGSGRQPVRSRGEIPAVESRLLRALRSPDDGPVVDRYLNRTVSAILTRGLLNSQVTPNQVTGMSLLAGLAGAWLLGREGGIQSLVGLTLFQLSIILDHVDGEIARLKYQYSRLGKWLDNFSDHAVDLAVIAFLTWRVAKGHPLAYFIVLGLAAALGVTGAFLVVFGWTMSGRQREARTTAMARLLARVLAALANRDGFCLALWLTLLLGNPEWFLWALALGANAYWVVWLLIYGLPVRSPSVEAGSVG